MVKTVIVSKEDMKVIQKYLLLKNDRGYNEDAVVLIDENILSDLTEEHASYIRKRNEGYANYNFYGEADIWVDVVDSTDHSFIEFLFPGQYNVEEDVK